MKNERNLTDGENYILDTLDLFFREDPKHVTKDLEGLLDEWYCEHAQTSYSRGQLQGPFYSVFRVNNFLLRIWDAYLIHFENGNVKLPDWTV